MTTYKLKATKRELFGRKLKALRKSGFIPGNVFGPNIKSLSVQFDKKSLVEIIKSAGETALVTVSIEGESKTHPVLVAGYHVDPVTGELLHVDLHEVNLKEKTTAAVPVRTVGEAPAVASGNVLVVLHNEIEVEALPTDLPESIEIDVSGLAEVGDTIHAKDLKVDRSKVTLEMEDDEPVVTIQEPAKEEEVAPAESEGEGEAPAAAEAPKEESEAKSE